MSEPMNSPYQNIDPDTLLEHFRLRGITVGTVELQHLHQVFSRSPALSHPELRDLLGNLLAKDDTQRHTITRLFNQLVPVDSEPQPDKQPSDNTTTGQQKPEPAPEDNLETDAEIKPPEPINIWRTGIRWLLLTAMVLIAVGFWMKDSAYQNKPPPSQTPVIRDSTPIEAIRDEEDEATEFSLVKTIDLWVPQIEVKPVSPWPRLLPALLLFLGAGLGFIWLLHQALQKTRLRIPKPPVLSRGRGRFHIPALAKQADYHLLSGDERREMSWGIQHYLSDLPLDKLDIERSVQRSAQTGIPQIEFQQASRDREVWLWQDQSATNPDLLRHIDEIIHTLRPANIHVQRGYFRGLPDLIRNDHGEVIWSSRHEYPENQPLVVIFTDGQRLAGAIQQHADHALLLLRLLHEWPHLCFVDHSQSGSTLPATLSAHKLDCLLPHEVAGWLAQQGELRQITSITCVLDDLHRWAVACALPERILAEDEMRALHDALGLNCGWQFHALKRYAEVHGQGLDFRLRRTGLLNEFSQWLNSAESDESEFAHKALTFWQQRNRDIDRCLTAQETEGGRRWDKTRKQQLLYLDQALLDLWQEPVTAAQALYDLHSHPKLQRDVERKLGRYCCPGLLVDNDQQAQQWILLPRAWDTLEPAVQQQLLLCGFGGVEDKPSRLRLDSITGVILALLAGLALSGLLGSAYVLWDNDTLIEAHPTSPQPPQAMVLESGREQGEHYFIGTYKGAAAEAHSNQGDEGYQGFATQEKHNNQQLVVSWQRKIAQPAQYEVKDEGETQVWLLGTEAKPQRPVAPDVRDWPQLSLAVIADDPEDRMVQKLAAHLLDTGNADRVLIGEEWQQTYRQWLTHARKLPEVQWLFIGEQPYPPMKQHHYAYFQQSPAELLALLQRDNQYIDAAAWAETAYNEPRLIARKPDEQQDMIELPQGMKLVKIPRGRFQMGSENGDDDEKPVRTVTINNEFWMSRTEVTFDQYDAFVADMEKQAQSPVSKQIEVPRKPGDSDWGRGNRPVIDVSWDDAQAYVRWLTETNRQGLSCRLPSEAEWEYAARGGTDTAYPWGNEIGKNNANCDGCGSQWDNKQTAPVASFKPNPFGLHDMHGNVWEWVQDCWHENYQNAPVEGSAWETECTDRRRVLRGGAWLSTPGNLRSALRYWNNPVVRYSNLGFRLVCSPIER